MDQIVMEIYGEMCVELCSYLSDFDEDDPIKAEDFINKFVFRDNWFYFFAGQVANKIFDKHKPANAAPAFAMFTDLCGLV